MKSRILGLICGFLNGLFGAGGGVVAVPMLKSEGLEPKKAHATSVCIIFFLSLVSAVFYFIGGRINLSASWIYIPGGVAGAFLGSVFLKKISNSLLRRIFGGIMIIFAVRLFLR